MASSDIAIALRPVASLAAGSLHCSLQQMETRRRGEGNSERKGRRKREQHLFVASASTSLPRELSSLDNNEDDSHETRLTKTLAANSPA